jgi:hypothetical protein
VYGRQALVLVGGVGVSLAERSPEATLQVAGEAEPVLLVLGELGAERRGHSARKRGVHHRRLRREAEGRVAAVARQIPRALALIALGLIRLGLGLGRFPTLGHVDELGAEGGVFLLLGLGCWRRREHHCKRRGRAEAVADAVFRS